MDSKTNPTRREALKRTAALLFGALGLGMTRSAAAQPVSAPERVFTLRGSEVHHRGVQGSLGDPQDGERLTLSGRLCSEDGTPIGAFRGTSCFVDGSFVSGASDGCIEYHTFELPNGTITGMGVCTWDASELAVVGGTGVYSGARGTYLASQSPVEYGGDGSATFVFRLTLASDG